MVCPGIYPQIYIVRGSNLFVRGSNEKQWGVRIISNFTKGDFLISYDNQVLLVVISHPNTKGKKVQFQPALTTSHPQVNHGTSINEESQLRKFSCLYPI